MKRIFLALAFLVFAAACTPSAEQPSFPVSGNGGPNAAENVSRSKEEQELLDRLQVRYPRWQETADKQRRRQALHPPRFRPRPQPSPSVRTSPHEIPLMGNVKTGLYHASDCDRYKSSDPTRAFTTIRDAERAGFRPCEICRGMEGTATKKKAADDLVRRGLAHRYLLGDPDTKMLHGPQCRSYRAKSGSMVFGSAEEAERLGYHPCPLCGGK